MLIEVKGFSETPFSQFFREPGEFVQVHKTERTQEQKLLEELQVQNYW